MAKLYFRYGAMGSSKTANALMVRFNYIERGQSVILIKPRTDTRDGARTIRSRIGLEAEGMFIDEFLAMIEKQWTVGTKPDTACLIADETQFLTEEQVDRLSDVVDKYGVPVICYGLRTDFQSKLFPGSKRLFELADVIEEIPTVCWCGHRAHFIARVLGGKLVTEGEQVFLGGNESYVPLCRKHFKAKDLGPSKKEA